MYAVSSGFREALRGGHQKTFAAEVLVNGVPTTHPTLNITGGQVDKDGNNAVRSKGRVTLVDRTGELTPESMADLITPAGHELKLYRGIEVAGVAENAPLGVFGMHVVDITSTAGGLQISLELYDRARRLEANRLISPYIIAAGTLYTDAIQALIASRFPGLTYNFAASPRTTPAMVLPEQGDPWKLAREMARSIGMELYFDGNGVCVLRPVPQATANAVQEIYSPTEAKLLGVSKRFTREGIVNHVVAMGEGTTNAVAYRGEASDLDSASPTYVGNFGLGYIPQWFPSPFFTSDEQCKVAASAELRRKIGRAENVSVTALVNPAHEPGDVIQLEHVRSWRRHVKTIVDALAVIDTMTIPLTANGAMPMTARRQQEVMAA